VQKAKEAGVAAYLTKPLREQDLWPAIELAFSHAEEMDTLKKQVEDLKEIIESRKIVEKAKGALCRLGDCPNRRHFAKCRNWPWTSAKACDR
jgi:response regulator NasT